MDPRVSRSFVRRRGAENPLVLIVDDGSETRDLYATFLEFHGFATLAAEDGVTGVSLAAAVIPDAIVLDFSMPRMDGADVLRCLERDPRTRGIPVVMVTAVPELVPRTARVACASFLEKPCEPDRLIQAIEDLVPTGLRRGAVGRRSGT